MYEDQVNATEGQIYIKAASRSRMFRPGDVQQKVQERYLTRTVSTVTNVFGWFCFRSVQATSTTANHLARWRKGTISAKTTWPVIMIPPSPIPLRQGQPAADESCLPVHR